MVVFLRFASNVLLCLPAVGAKMSYFGLPVVGTAKFRIFIACQKGLDKQDRPRSDSYYALSLIRSFPFAILTRILLISALITIIFLRTEREVFEVLEHLTYLSRGVRFPTMWMCDQQRLRPACAYAQSGQSLC